MSPQAILFDFDGTLIDSARSILAGFELALTREGLQPAVPLAPSLIGPPLPKTLATLAGTEDPAVIMKLTAAYREAYDGGGYRQTEVYPGVTSMLEGLAEHRISLHIVTNKRIVPTRLILDHLESEGALDEAAIHPRNVVKRALDIGAAALILVHNHPSGSSKPSRADIQITNRIAEAGRLLGIVVHDHVIIARHGHTSLRAKGLV